ncbi:restriction endonuclease subunit S [Nocardia arizonensis]|uniref:restriction endonuclease subunit S n=1 Tax=Nocardia arizonensis TaxID=1141647 RepID=UPI0009EA4BA2|nr:restriction endonuclease subunit S [Nocardia arizonensis]
MDNLVHTTFGGLGQLFDGPHATPGRLSEGPYFLNISSLRAGRLDLAESDHVSEEDFERWTRRVTPQPGDLLFSYETRIGEAALMPDGVRACLGRRMALLRPDLKVVEPRFLLYFYLGPQFQRTIAQNTIHGATVPRIGLATMPSWPVVVPSLPQQRAISEVLGALDDKIAANHRIDTTANTLGDALFESVVAASYEIPRASMRDLTGEGVLTYGDGYRTKRSEHGQPGMRIVRAGDIQHGRIVLSGEDFVSNDYISQVGVKACRSRDIVLTTKGTVGRVAVVPDDIPSSVYSPQLCYFRVAENHGRIQPWLAAWFRSPDRIRQTDIAMHKSDMAPYVNLQDIGALRVPIVDLDAFGPTIEQLDSLQNLGHAIARENVALAKTRDELLPLLMSGKLRVKDAEKKVEEMV